MKSNPPLISEWDYLSGMSISSTRLHFMTLFYRNLSLGKDLPRRIDLLRVKMYIFSPLLCQVHFSLLLKLIFCKCNLVQWFAFERCWISFLDVVHVSLAIFANNLQLSAFQRKCVTKRYQYCKNAYYKNISMNSSATTYLEQQMFEDLETKTRRETQSKLKW